MGHIGGGLRGFTNFRGSADWTECSTFILFSFFVCSLAFGLDLAMGWYRSNVVTWMRWQPSRVGGVFDNSFEYRGLSPGRWQTCTDAALNRAIARHNWVISGDPDQACSSSVGTTGGMGFLLSGLAGSEEIGAKLSGLGEFNGDDNFSFLRIYTRRR